MVGFDAQEKHITSLDGIGERTGCHDSLSKSGNRFRDRVVSENLAGFKNSCFDRAQCQGGSHFSTSDETDGHGESFDRDEVCCRVLVLVPD